MKKINEKELHLQLKEKKMDAQSKEIQETKIEKSNDVKTFRALIPSKLDEKIVRMYKEHIHSVQSEYDTYVKNTSLEKDLTSLRLDEFTKKSFFSEI